MSDIAPVTTRPDYNSDQAADNPASHPAAARPEDFVAVEEFLHLLARAARQFHTYPATSPLCTEAIAACHKALTALDGRERLTVWVTPTTLTVDELTVSSSQILELELIHRLHDAGAVRLDIDRIATPRHLSHFCLDLLRCGAIAKTQTTLADLLAEHGVETIVVQMARRPEVLDLGVPAAPLVDLVGHEQRRRQTASASSGPVDYL